ncbi:hypothetical protein MNVI_01030 [Mycobacterium noviomagense]|uniref:Uncharacterized protein n=1 Tax=Mycobacterium noviomagense TaxID=459858 RepID=A0A7I7P7J9_9MYCO|nr:hypothetical protein MNVI_01030 [Mycobacterium noviomagense]
MLRFAANLPDPPVGLAPVLDRLFHLRLEHRPQRLGDLLTGSGVQVERVEKVAPNVVLVLVVGAVADTDRARVVVAGEMVQLFFFEGALPPTPYITCSGWRSPLLAPETSAMNEKKSSASRSRPRV